MKASYFHKNNGKNKFNKSGKKFHNPIFLLEELYDLRHFYMFFLIKIIILENVIKLLYNYLKRRKVNLYGKRSYTKNE